MKYDGFSKKQLEEEFEKEAWKLHDISEKWNAMSPNERLSDNGKELKAKMEEIEKLTDEIAELIHKQ